MTLPAWAAAMIDRLDGSRRACGQIYTSTRP